MKVEAFTYTATCPYCRSHYSGDDRGMVREEVSDCCKWKRQTFGVRRISIKKEGTPRK